MNEKSDVRKAALQVIESLTGQANVLTVPVEFIGYTGSFESALLLNQLLYWQPRTKNPNGWIYKTYEDWKREIYLSEYKVRKAATVLKDKGILETKIKKANGNPTVHYIFDTERFTESFLEYLQNRNLSDLGMDAEASAESLTETTAETTTEITTKYVKEYKEPSAPSSVDSQSQDLENLDSKEEATSLDNIPSPKAGGDGSSPFLVSDSEPFGQVFSDWCAVMELPDAVANKKRRAAVCSRLKEGYSVDDLKLATRGILQSKWHMGGNEAKVMYNDLELICRDGVQVEKFRDLARANGIKPTDPIRKSATSAASGRYGARAERFGEDERRDFHWDFFEGDERRGAHWRYENGRREDLSDEEGRRIEAEKIAEYEGWGRVYRLSKDNWI